MSSGTAGEMGGVERYLAPYCIKEHKMTKRTTKATAATIPMPLFTQTRTEQFEANHQCRPHGGVCLEEAIRVRAFQMWERAGKPEGEGLHFWLEAEKELKACK